MMRNTDTDEEGSEQESVHPGPEIKYKKPHSQAVGTDSQQATRDAHCTTDKCQACRAVQPGGTETLGGDRSWSLLP
eukprot:798383-Rhodomonas_salina.2